MRKLLISDLDGTLFFKKLDQTTISEENIKAIKEFKDAGNIFAIATGRGASSRLEVCEMLGFTMDYIGMNGAHIIFNDGTSFASVITKDYIIPVKALLEKEKVNATLCLNTANHIFYINRDHFPFSNASIEYERSSSFMDNHGTNLNNSFDNVSEDILKYMLIIHPDDMLRTKELLREKFKGQLEVVSSDTDIIDIMNIGVSKGEGIQLLAQKYAIDLKDCAAVGDNDNDISMFKVVGNAYAMANSEEIVKKNAHKIVESVKNAIKDYTQ